MWYTALNIEKKSSPVPGERESNAFDFKKLAPLGGTLGTLFIPKLSPSTSGAVAPSDQHNAAPAVSEGSGDSGKDKTTGVWFINAFEWHGDRNLYSIPAAPGYFVSGEPNKEGYGWIYLPFSRTGMTYDQGYFEWAEETIASMGGPGIGAGAGPLVE